MTHTMTRSLLAALSLPLFLSACGDGRDQLAQDAATLGRYYVDHPSDRGWKVLGITVDPNEAKLVVQVLVTSESDVNRIKSLSRLEQFSAAKYACPKMTAELRAVLDKNTRIWIRLQTGKKELTSSICPGT